jgi:hypothetical protein
MEIGGINMIGNQGGNWKLRPTLHEELGLKKLGGQL